MGLDNRFGLLMGLTGGPLIEIIWNKNLVIKKKILIINKKSTAMYNASEYEGFSISP